MLYVEGEETARAMAGERILLLELPPPLCERARAEAELAGVDVVVARAQDPLEANDIPVGLCVAYANSEDGAIATLRRARKGLAGVPVVVLNDGVLGSSAVLQLARLGVADVIDLVSPDPLVLRPALPHMATRGSDGLGDLLVGESDAVRQLRELIRVVARTSSTVLLLGETGTGKGLVARTIHELSRQAGHAFVHTDCTVFSPSVIESELFGHERGAFTSASGLRRGRFEQAERGTIFLDEIGDLDPSLQVKLLRVLQDRVYERVGGGESLEMTARVIAATNTDLTRAVRDGRFRPDLYYRLRVFEIEIPPLRERTEDMSALVRAQVPALAERLGVHAPRVGRSFCDALARHRWPGNVRELINVLERCLIERRVDSLEAEDAEGILDVIPPAVRAEAPAPGRRRAGAERLVGTSAAMRIVRERIGQIATTRANVLITGETGTGKDLAAHAIHEASGRGPLLELGVAELSNELLELELFGRESGNGGSSRTGVIEQVHGGTVILGEIGEAPLSLQAKILRVLDTGEVRRLGATQPREVDVRVIATTQHDLQPAVDAGSLRRDLYYRLSEATLYLPPLRERVEDVEPIARALREEVAAEQRLPIPEVADEVYEALAAQSLPGNVRELRTVFQNLLMGWRGCSRLRLSDLMDVLSVSMPHMSAEDLATSQRMVRAYRRCDGNQEAARRELGLSRGEWRHRWARYRLDVFRRSR